MKKCTICKQNKPLSEYHNMTRAKDGKRSQCKICHIEANRKFRKQNKEHCIEINKKYYAKNKEQILRRSREAYSNDPQKYLAKNKKWATKNKKKTNEYRRQWQKNKWHNDINYKIKSLLRGRLYKAVNNEYKYSTVTDYLGCTIDELKIYLAAKFTEGMTWENHGDWHIDHIKPCSSFDLTNLDEQKKCFHYTNLQPLWAEDNLRKSSRLCSPN